MNKNINTSGAIQFVEINGTKYKFVPATQIPDNLGELIVKAGKEKDEEEKINIIAIPAAAFS